MRYLASHTIYFCRGVYFILTDPTNPEAKPGAQARLMITFYAEEGANFRRSGTKKCNGPKSYNSPSLWYYRAACNKAPEIALLNPWSARSLWGAKAIYTAYVVRTAVVTNYQLSSKMKEYKEIDLNTANKEIWEKVVYLFARPPAGGRAATGVDVWQETINKYKLSKNKQHQLFLAKLERQ